MWPWVEEYGPDEKDYAENVLRGFDIINSNDPLLLKKHIVREFPLPLRRTSATLKQRLDEIKKLPPGGKRLPPLIEGHRAGWSLGVENTLPLFERALGLEFMDSIELDVS